MHKYPGKRLLVCVSYTLISTLLISCGPKPEALPQTPAPSINSTLSTESNDGFYEKIRAYMSRFEKNSTSPVTDEDFINGGIKIDTRLLMDMSAEGGEIARYEDGEGRLIRYRLKFYGETGRSERSYYFIDDFVYYTELLEEYRTPINVDAADTEILLTTMTEGIIIDGVCYRYDPEQDDILKSDILTDAYTLEELNSFYESAENSSS